RGPARRRGPGGLPPGAHRVARAAPRTALRPEGDRSGRGGGEDRGPGEGALREELGRGRSDSRRVGGDGRGDHGFATGYDMESARLRILAVLALALALGGCGSDSDEDREPRPGNWDLRIRGMEGTAKVSFDEDGVLHARCLTDGDCLRVLGYFHASHRFFQ